MQSFKFLFGHRGGSGASIGDKIKSGAQSQLHGKIIRAPVNKWWVVLLRQYIFWPVVKFPMLPVVEAMHARKKFLGFDRVKDVLADQGFKTKHSPLDPLKRARRLKSGYLKAIRYSLRSLLWKPTAHPGRDNIGRVILAEHNLCLKLFMITLAMWLGAAGLFAGAVVRLWHEGTHLLFQDLGHVFSGNFIWAVAHSQSLAFKLWLGCCFTWSIALITAFVLAHRPWMKLTEYVKEFLRSSGAFRPDEVDQKMVALALPDVIFISTPSMNINKIRGLNAGWPAGFQPGEIIENTKRPDDVLVIKRPEKDPIVFGGDFARSDILSHLKAYESGILKVMKDAVKKPSDQEMLFLGEVIESRWWQSSQIFTTLASNPHCFICGQTRSGKTKSALSFVYSFARAYPDTQWFFCDGKGSPDYDPFADFLSIFPVAKPDDKTGDSLVQFANIIDNVWNEYARRRSLFAKAQLDGKPCSSIYQYRELVGPLPQIWLVIDEFSVFLNEMSFEHNWRTDGTIANRLKRLVAEAASSGIHLLFASQRYQVTDMPSVMRSNLTVRMVHNVQLKDGDLLECPEATTLDSGQFYVTAQGLFCRHTGISKVKAKLPYVGDHPHDLLMKTVTPIPKSQKSEFDFHLIYNKGSDDLEKMSVGELCLRLQRFFRDQDYHSIELVQDLEATELQIELTKAKKVKVTREDGQVVTELRPIQGAPRIGVSVLRADEIDEDTLFGIQAKYNMYSAIMIFVLGKSIQASKFKFVTRLNEVATRFCVVPFREYFKDMRFVEMKRKQGQAVDVIQPKLQRLGLSDVSHAVAAKGILTSELTSKSPIKLKISKILEMVRLDKSQQSGESRNIPYTATVLPGGTELYFLIVSTKNERDDAKDLAILSAGDGKAVIIVSTDKFTATDVRQLNLKGILVWKTTQVDEVLARLEDKDANQSFVGDLMLDLRLIRHNNPTTANIVTIGPNAKILLSCQANPETNRILSCKLTCETTGYTIVLFQEMDIDRFRLDYLGIPDTARVTVTDGMAPLTTDPAKVKIKLGSKGNLTVFPPSSRWEVSQGVLQRKKAAIEESDPLLADMKKAASP